MSSQSVPPGQSFSSESSNPQGFNASNTLEGDERFFFGQLFAECSAMELLKQILAHSHHAIVITDAVRSEGYRIMYGNKVFCRHTGYELSELIGQSPAILQGPKSNYEVIERISPELEASGFFYGSSVNYRKDGSMYPVEWNISAIRNDKGEVTHYLSMQKDLSHLQHLAQQITHSNEMFKQYVKQNASSEQENLADVVETLKENDKIAKNSLFTEESGVGFEDFFEDFSSEEASVVDTREKKQAMSAAEFWAETPFENEDVLSIIESIEEVDAEIGIVDSQGLTEQRIEHIATGFAQIANNLYFCIEFNEGALIIDEVSKSLRAHLSCTNFPVAVLSAFNKDVSHWIEEIFVEKHAENIFSGEENVIGTGNQLLTFLQQMPERQQADNSPTE